MFSFNENTYDSFYDPSTGSAGAVPGQVQDIKIKNVFLFNGIQGAVRVVILFLTKDYMD